MPDQDPRLILLVERDEEDVFLFRRMLAACSFTGSLRPVRSERQALDYLHNKPPLSDKQYHRKPQLVVLTCAAGVDADCEFLQTLKEECAGIPVVFWIATVHAREAERLRAAGAAAVVLKEEEFARNLESCRELLMHLAKPPSR